MAEEPLSLPGATNLMSNLAVARFSYFPTLVFRIDLPDAEALNERLMALISEVKKADGDGIEKSNSRYLGGWHSRGLLHKLPGFELIVGYIHNAGERISGDLRYDETLALRISSMWTIVNPPGAFNLAHVHPGCLWSGVYYVKTPDACGKISFTDPRTANVMSKPKYTPKHRVPRMCWSKVSFEPVAGRMLVFPSWLYHAVEPNRATPTDGSGLKGDRVIISFNLSQRNKQQIQRPRGHCLPSAEATECQ
jgi:uncharacterized protein (TIGR02466 family)